MSTGQLPHAAKLWADASEYLAEAQRLAKRKGEGFFKAARRLFRAADDIIVRIIRQYSHLLNFKHFYGKKQKAKYNRLIVNFDGQTIKIPYNKLGRKLKAKVKLIMSQTTTNPAVLKTGAGVRIVDVQTGEIASAISYLDVFVSAASGSKLYIRDEGTPEEFKVRGEWFSALSDEDKDRAALSAYFLAGGRFIHPTEEGIAREGYTYDWLWLFHTTLMTWAESRELARHHRNRLSAHTDAFPWLYISMSILNTVGVERGLLLEMEVPVDIQLRYAPPIR